MADTPTPSAMSVTLVPMEIGTLALFLTGAVLLIVGMGFFQLGAEMSMTPLGEGVGKTLAKREKVILVVLVAFALGTIITIAEPDLQEHDQGDGQHARERFLDFFFQLFIHTVAVVLLSRGDSGSLHDRIAARQARLRMAMNSSPVMVSFS